MNNNESRVIWYFTIGISNDNSVIKQNFKNAVYEITEDITKITGGVTYEYCYGTWKDDNIENNIENKIENNIEHDMSVRIYVIVLPDIADDVYNSIKQIISRANEKYTLSINHVQAIKTYGFAKHFIV